MEKGVKHEIYEHKHTKYKLKETDTKVGQERPSIVFGALIDTGLEIPPKTQTAGSI